MQTEQVIRTNGWGIDLNYRDVSGEWHETPVETIDALQNAMKADPGLEAPGLQRSVMVVRFGEMVKIQGTGEITLESGGVLTAYGRLPADVPVGYHWMLLEGATDPCRLIVGPAHCWMPEGLQTWGWAVQLYGARSTDSWGMGDLADLETLAAWSARAGAGMMLVNPLSAACPLAHQEASPYYPSSRRFLNPLWLRIDSAEGGDIAELAKQAQSLNRMRMIDRNRVFELKMRALNARWLRFGGDAAFTVFCRKRGDALETYATYCALAEHYGSGWRSWPTEFQHPKDEAVTAFATSNRSRVDFHKWLQWQLDGQMARCCEHLALMQDLPIGVSPDGADSWTWQDVLAEGAAIGAPPDEFNTQGQNWGLPPFIPHKLKAAAYEPFIQTVRAAMRNVGGLRIDHVMGLFRLFWIPQGMSGSQGAYVRYDYEDLLTIVALESERARAYVVGEDLGTVEEETRRQLSAHRILSYRLLWFEKDHPAEFPHEALAAVTTHDLPTVAGLWSGADFERQKALGLKPNEASTDEIHSRLQLMAGLKDRDSMEAVIEKTYQLLARAPSRILTAALDDAAQVEERPNLPATTEKENWSMALPVPIEQLMAARLPRRIAAALVRSR